MQVAAGGSHTCVLLSNGRVQCWGLGTNGQLGHGSTDTIELASSAEAVAVTGNGGAQIGQIATGESHTCALLSNGRVRCWGLGANGRLGYGNEENIGDHGLLSDGGDVSVSGSAANTVVQIAAGGGHTCALLSNGKLSCWGAGAEGQLGYGNTNSVASSAGNVDVGGDVIQVTAGGRHTCALLSNGKLSCWGAGAEGQLGYGNTNNVGTTPNNLPSSARNVDVGGDVIQVAAGQNHTCALLSDGNVRCWGWGASGRLGYANTNNVGDHDFPSSAGSVEIGGKAIQIVAARMHTCALLAIGTVRCWGSGASGVLGYGNTLDIGDNERPSKAGDLPLQ